MRFLILFPILILLNTYAILKIAYYFNITTAFTRLFIIILLVALQSIGLLDLQKILLQLEQILGISGLSVFVYQVSYLLLGIVQCLVVYILFTDLTKFALLRLWSSSSQIYITFCKISLPLVLFTTLITTTIGIINVVKGPIVEEIDIVLAKLPVNLDGFTIAQISDLHVSSTIKRNYVEKVVNITNALKPNLIVLTGDIIDGNTNNLRTDVEPLANLKATHGTFFVSGNHEYYSGIESWLEEFNRLGIVNLRNQYVLVKQNSEQFVLAGVTGYSTIGQKNIDEASSPTRAILGAPNNLVKILLAHQPASYIEAKKAGFDLQLSGHTHAGQFFPFTFFIKFFHRYYKGLNNHEGMWLYINRGTGYWGPPLRTNSSEITLLTLRSRQY